MLRFADYVYIDVWTENFQELYPIADAETQKIIYKKIKKDWSQIEFLYRTAKSKELREEILMNNISLLDLDKEKSALLDMLAHEAIADDELSERGILEAQGYLRKRGKLYSAAACMGRGKSVVQKLAFWR